ncbi:MAG: PD-(D/E)XK nuclease family protein [Pseudomonadota bacterium]|nr:PD-(D/E)XK nuclease family protein [Pseudomonadota bacterium]
MERICDGLIEEVKALDQHLSKFNALEAAGMTNQEIKHSRTLASLLTPSIKGTLVPEKNLKKFISAFLGSDIDIGNSKDIEVYCEKYHIDILILNKKEKWLCAIENKVYAGQHGDQLKRYKNTIDRKYKDYRKSLLYLTLEKEVGFDSRDDDWRNITHQDVIDVLKTVKLNKGKHALEFLQEQYIELMEYKILAKINSFNDLRDRYEEGVDELYQQAHYEKVRGKYVEYIKKFVPKCPGIKLTVSNASYIRFYYNSWEGVDIIGSHDALKNKDLPEKIVPIMFEIVNDKPNNPESTIYIKLIFPTSCSMNKSERASAIQEIQKVLNYPLTKKHGDYTAIWKSTAKFKASSPDFMSIGYIGTINKWWDAFIKECEAMNIEQVVLDVLKKYESKS